MRKHVRMLSPSCPRRHSRHGRCSAHRRPAIHFKRRAASRSVWRRLFGFPSRMHQPRERSAFANHPHHTGTGWPPEPEWIAGTSLLRVVPCSALAVKGLSDPRRVCPSFEHFPVCKRRSQKGGGV